MKIIILLLIVLLPIASLMFLYRIDLISLNALSLLTSLFLAIELFICICIIAKGVNKNE
jgi:hypothetical protein